MIGAPVFPQGAGAGEASAAAEGQPAEEDVAMAEPKPAEHVKFDSD